MKAGTAQNLTVIFLLAFVLIALPIQVIAADQGAVSGIDHTTQAQYYTNQANELQAKIEDQIDALNHKPRSSFFGRNGQNIKKHVEFKIHQYEVAIADNLKKAAYHQKMAAEQQLLRPASVPSGKTKS